MKTTARITRCGSIPTPSARVSCAAVDVALAMCVQSYSLFINILASFSIQCFTRWRELSVYLKTWSTCIHHNYFAYVLICECKMCKKRKKKEKRGVNQSRNIGTLFRSLQSRCSVLQHVSAIMWPYLELRGLLCSEQHAACFCYHRSEACG